MYINILFRAFSEKKGRAAGNCSGVPSLEPGPFSEEPNRPMRRFVRGLNFRLLPSDHFFFLRGSWEARGNQQCPSSHNGKTSVNVELPEPLGNLAHFPHFQPAHIDFHSKHLVKEAALGPFIYSGMDELSSAEPQGERPLQFWLFLIPPKRKSNSKTKSSWASRRPCSSRAE